MAVYEMGRVCQGVWELKTGGQILYRGAENCEDGIFVPGFDEERENHEETFAFPYKNMFCFVVMCV